MPWQSSALAVSQEPQLGKISPLVVPCVVVMWVRISIPRDDVVPPEATGSCLVSRFCSCSGPLLSGTDGLGARRRQSAPGYGLPLVVSKHAS